MAWFAEHYPLPFTRQVERKIMLDKQTKDKIIGKFKTHAQDTGSAEVQIAILTEEINRLTEHLKTHKKDFSSRRGLLKKISQRRRLLKFLKRENEKSFERVVKKLKINIKISDIPQELPEEIEEGLEAEKTDDINN